MSRHFKTNYLKKQKQRYFKRLVLFFICFFVLSSIIYFVIFSNFFKIKDIKIYGLKRVPKEVVQKEISNILNEKKLISINNNLLFINDTAINKVFSADIRNIHITKNFFTKTLNVHVNEKQPIAKIVMQQSDSVFVNSSDSFYLDENGNIFRSNLLDNQKFISIEIQNQIDTIPKNFWDQEKIKNFNNLINYLNQKYINKFSFDYSLNTPSAITLHLSDLYIIHLTLNDQIIDAFKTAEEFTKKENISNYIDMRFYPEKLYYK